MEPIKVHPYDVYRMMNERRVTFDMLIDYKFYEEKELPEHFYFIDGQLYEETTSIPPSEEALKVIK